MNESESVEALSADYGCATYLGSYPSQSGNTYIVGLEYLYSVWLDFFAVSDNTAATIAYLIIEEYFQVHAMARHC